MLRRMPEKNFPIPLLIAPTAAAVPALPVTAPVAAPVAAPSVALPAVSFAVSAAPLEDAPLSLAN